MARKKKEEVSYTDKSLFDVKSEMTIDLTKKEEYKKVQRSHFDLIRSIFMNNGDLSDYSNLEKERFFFMFNRSCAIKYPLQAELMNISSMNKIESIEILKNLLISREGLGKIPSFFFRKGSKKYKDDEVQEIKWTQSLKEKYALWKHLSIKDIDDLIEFFPNDMKDELLKFKKRLELIENPNKQIK